MADQRDLVSGIHNYGSAFVCAACSFADGQTGAVRDMRGGPGRLWGICQSAYLPDLSDFAGLCKASVGFAGIFYGILEFYDPDGRRAARAASDGSACGVGVCTVSFSREAGALVCVYAPDGLTFPGYDGFRLSGP